MTEPIHVRTRKFIQEFFNDEELETFSFDYFPQVYNNFTRGLKKNEKVLELVSYSQRFGRFDDLLAALGRERPKSYHEYFAEQLSLIDPEPEAPKTTERNPKQIFISHAHQDIEFAHQLAKDLRAIGWQTWIAQDNIRPGEKWVEAINRGLSESGVFVLVLTPTAAASSWVQSEMNVAIGMEHRKELRLIPLVIENVTVPPLWQVYQFISFYNDYHTGINELLAILEPDNELAELYKRLQKALSKKNWNLAHELIFQIEKKDKDYLDVPMLAVKVRRKKRLSSWIGKLLLILTLSIIIFGLRYIFDGDKVDPFNATATAQVQTIEAQPTSKLSSASLVTEQAANTTAFPRKTSPATTIQRIATRASSLQSTATQTIEPSPTDTIILSSTPTETLTTLTAITIACSIPQLHVTSTSANVRSGPDTNYGIVATVNKGDLYPVIARNSSGSWYIIQLGEDENGWIYATLGEIVTTEVCNEEVPVAATVPVLPSSSPAPTPTPTGTPTQMPSPLPLPLPTPVETKPSPPPTG